MVSVRERPAKDERAPAPHGAPGRVIVVLGYHEIGDDGRHGISPICRAAFAAPRQLAAESRRVP